MATVATVAVAVAVAVATVASATFLTSFGIGWESYYNTLLFVL